MATALITIPDSFGSGGANLSPGGNGTPNLRDVLRNHGTVMGELTGDIVQKRTVTVLEADLVAAATTQSINIGAALPANARVIGYDFHDYTPFTGGSISAMKGDIGTSGDADAIVAAAELFAAAVDGGPATIPQGVRPNKLFVAAGAQLVLKFTATGDNVVNATAGAVTVDVLFAVLP